MEAWRLRLATRDDAGALARLGRQTFIETFVEDFAIPYPADDLAAFLATSFAVEKIEAQIAASDHRWWVAMIEDRIVGFSRSGPCGLPHPDARSSHAELKSLYVERTAQGRGVGRGLIELALDWMEAESDGPLWLGVWSGNLKAQRFYGHYGFSKAGEYDYPVGRWRDRELILRRSAAR